MAKEQYDAIAADYVRVKAHDIVDQYAAYPSFYAAIGNVRGKRVLDLACGEGKVGREMWVRGASYVLGIDSSVKMLELAASRRPATPLVEYRKGHVGQMGKIGQFDVAAAGWLLHYSATREELFSMCKDIAANLRPGGIFVTLNENPWNPLGGDKEHGYVTTSESKVPKDGDVMTVTIFGDCASTSFQIYHWSCETYIEALSNAGLSFQTRAITPTDQGYRMMRPGWWEEVEKRATGIVFKSQKL